MINTENLKQKDSNECYVIDLSSCFLWVPEFECR